MSQRSLPADVQKALEQGRLIEAIKLLRKHTGVGLAEAKQAIESFGNTGKAELPPPAHTLPGAPHSMPSAAMDALQKGNKIEAIRLYRLHMQTGLKEAKDAIDAYEARLPYQPGSGLAPGEVPHSSGGKWFAGAIAVLLIVLVVMAVRRLA
jgi:ribosomal protein L7/L12